MSTKENIKTSKALEKQALENCNNEPIEWIESVQSHGVLLAFDFDSLMVTHASKNLDTILKLDAKAALSKSIREVFNSLFC